VKSFLVRGNSGQGFSNGYPRPYKWTLRAILFYFHTLSSSLNVNKGFRRALKLLFLSGGKFGLIFVSVAWKEGEGGGLGG